MEADSTTYENTSKTNDNIVPFSASKGNLQLYTELTSKLSERNLESQIVERLQRFGLLPTALKCLSNKPDCRLLCRPARVVDRMQWYCEGCGKRQPVRTCSFFLRLQCSLLQALQTMLAWCEDADCTDAAEHFGVKPKVASMIYDKLDELAVKEHKKLILGGENSVVLAEMYPDCLNRLSPDTTDQAHVHRMLMLADTNHIPTAYKIHVIRNELKKQSVSTVDSQSLQAEVEQFVSRVTAPQSLVVTSGNVPPVAGAACLPQLAQHCDPDMQHFLNTRIWRQAVTLCNASRDICASGSVACAGAVQRYLDTALFRLRTGSYRDLLATVAAQYTDEDKCDVDE